MTVADVSAATSPLGATGAVRRLFLVWQNPQTRRFAPVGVLERQPEGSFLFRYIRQALETPGFRPLVAFPELNGAYRSEGLPAFFENRIMSSRRPDFSEWVEALDLDPDTAGPMELLARAGGSRATDTFNLVAEPEVDASGRATLLFLAHGVRHLDGATNRIERLSAGDELHLRLEPTNPMNERALLVDDQGGEPVGYVPDWMLECVHDLLAADSNARVSVEHVNGPAAPNHLRLLCRLEAVLPSGYRPFTGPQYDYLS
jgi:hypothetical protein